MGKLNTLRVRRASGKGLHGDGGGLYLQVSARNAKSWVFRFALHGRSRTMGLGSVRTLTLAEARERARDARKMLLDGIDPIEARKARRQAARLDAAKSVTFKDAAEQFIASHQAGWRNAEHQRQWTATLASYVYPVIGGLPVAACDTPLILKVLQPLWETRPETASRVRGRIESVLDWATARGFRIGDNPARWRGHLDHLLPARSKVRRVAHHPALDYREIGDFMGELRRRDGIAARALEFAILTASRTGETIGATWEEIDLAEKVWTIPAERMKAGKEHRVPLSAPALAVIAEMAPLRRPGGFVFPGRREGRPLAETAMLHSLQAVRTGLTVHGFRSTFRDWAAEGTNFPREVAELALAHAIGTAVERAYHRGDLVAKRRQLMDAWGRHCAMAQPAGGTVTRLHGEGAGA